MDATGNIYRPVTAVWEITMACNMRCRHCGSSCATALEDELSTEEALGLCDSLGEMGFQWVTISGGEPTIRKDWHLIASRLKQNGIIPNIITNGWNFNSEVLLKAMDAGVNTVAVSLDGTEQTHDYIRKKGSFRRINNAFELMGKTDSIYSAVITTINKWNIRELYQLKDLLAEKNVTTWQLQIALPMGNMKEIDDLVIEPYQVEEIIDFAYNVQDQCRMSIQLADCIGYYGNKEVEIRKKGSRTSEYSWQGCPAGKFSMGILHNGDILGCTSVRDKRFIEGNIRKTSLMEIWNNPDSFYWNRNLSGKQLKGHCGKCKYADKCRGGCSNTKLTMGGSIYSENIYCLYNLYVKKEVEKYVFEESLSKQYAIARDFASKGEFQIAESLLTSLLEKNPREIDLLLLHGYVCFMLENYCEAKKANEKVLFQKPLHVYANKGLGLCYYRIGNTKKAIYHLAKAIKYADESFLDPYYDLAVVLFEEAKYKIALTVLEKGRKKSNHFRELSQELYNKLKKYNDM